MFRIFLVEDNEVLSRLASTILVRDGHTVVGAARSEVGLLEQLERLKPDVVLLDLQMPNSFGMDLVQPIQESGAHVIVWSSLPFEPYREQALALGAKAYVPKQAGAAPLCGAIAMLVQTESSVGPI